jgi:tRNA-binding protein
MLDLAPQPTVSIEQFFGCDLRVGTVTACGVNAKARKPAYVLTLDFGPLGVKTSSAQITQLYTPEQLLGRQVLAVVNFAPRKVADITSECLTLAVDGEGGLVLLATERPVANGARVY